jgi:hypothetical protein
MDGGLQLEHLSVDYQFVWNLMVGNRLLLAIIYYSRRNELALFIIPRAMETIFNLFKKRGYISNLKNGEMMIFALIMGIIHYFYQHEVYINY